MKFTLSWLKEHLDTTADIDTIANTLTNIGLEVETFEDKSEEFKYFTVAKVMSATKHPNADRLKVCEVQTNKGIFQVVCGAPNAQTGLLGIFAPVDTFIPGTKMHLKQSEIRGAESCGMLLSERELGISDEHEGIIELTNIHKIGDPAAKIFGFDDPVIEINITPNRSDCLSVRGIARDLAAAGLGSLIEFKVKKIKGDFDSDVKWVRKFNPKDEYLCPGVSGRFFKNVHNTTSPDWLKRRLTAIGLRPISALVDITNYITHDLGRPLHVYDADKLSGNLTMRKAIAGEKCKTLDEKEYLLTEDMVVISDDNNLHGIGGVMGGLESGCSLETRNVFIEVALFDPISVTKTGRKLNLQSDARYRFERGVDPTSITWGVDVATQMIKQICGGGVSVIESDKSPIQKNTIVNFDTNATKTLGGINIDTKDQLAILNNLGFLTKFKKNTLIEITVPTFRPDIKGAPDIVEEILRIYGFDKIKPISLLKDSNGNAETLNANLKSFYKSKRLIANRGYLEIVSWSFIDSKEANFINNNSSIDIKNPISSDLNAMRPSTFPNLLNVINPNIARLYTNGKLFEVGPNFHGFKETDQQMVATGIQYGLSSPPSWLNEKRATDVYDVKSDVYHVLDKLNVPVESLVYKKLQNKVFHPGKSAQLKLGNSIIANFGELNPLLLQRFDIKTVVCGFEIFIDNLEQFQSKKTSTKKAYDGNPYQAVERDFAFLFPNNIQAIDLINNIKKINKQIIKKVIIFDVFEGKKLAEDKKSIALKVVLQPLEKTFTDSEIETISKKIIALMSESFEGELRQ